jgi:REP element-mobilizing transposase RayT
MSPPLAFFLTSTYYGQRLHGDERGSVDDAHNARGTPYLAADERRFRAALGRMRGPIVEFTPPMRRVADSAIVELCTSRGWHLIARNVRSTHVHVIVSCREARSPERVLAQFKARITRGLREAGLADEDAALWTEHGSTRWINHERGLYAAIAYVNEWQSGANREILEERKREIRDRIRRHREWMRGAGLPLDGRTVVVGEDEEERARRVAEHRQGC